LTAVTHKTGKRLILASPLILVAALLVQLQVFGNDAYVRWKVPFLWVVGALWFCLCLVLAVRSWGND
jgi:intracellular septation protein A